MLDIEFSTRLINYFTKKFYPWNDTMFKLYERKRIVLKSWSYSFVFSLLKNFCAPQNFSHGSKPKSATVWELLQLSLLSFSIILGRTLKSSELLPYLQRFGGLKALNNFWNTCMNIFRHFFINWHSKSNLLNNNSSKWIN